MNTCNTTLKFFILVNTKKVCLKPRKFWMKHTRLLHKITGLYNISPMLCVCARGGAVVQNQVVELEHAVLRLD